MTLSVQGHGLGAIVLYFTLILLTCSGIFFLSPDILIFNFFFFQMTHCFFVLIWHFNVNTGSSDGVLKEVMITFGKKTEGKYKKIFLYCRRRASEIKHN